MKSAARLICRFELVVSFEAHTLRFFSEGELTMGHVPPGRPRAGRLYLASQSFMGPPNRTMNDNSRLNGNTG
jgi:hypothetical protein